MRIKKTSQYIEGGASLSNEYGTSNSDGYTQEYINGVLNDEDSGTITITETGTSGTINYVKVGRIVQLNIEGKITTSVSGSWKSVKFATLPDKLKPLQGVGVTTARDSQSTLFYVLVSANGWCGISDRGRANLTSSNESIVACLTYISAE